MKLFFFKYTEKTMKFKLRCFQNTIIKAQIIE